MYENNENVVIDNEIDRDQIICMGITFYTLCDGTDFLRKRARLVQLVIVFSLQGYSIITLSTKLL